MVKMHCVERWCLWRRCVDREICNLRCTGVDEHGKDKWADKL